MARSYRLQIIQNESLRREFEWRVNGEVQDLAGYVVKSEIREYDSMDAPLILDLSPYMSIVDNKIVLLVPGKITATLRAHRMRDARWDMFLVSETDENDRHLLVEGEAGIESSVTRVDVVP